MSATIYYLILRHYQLSKLYSASAVIIILYIHSAYILTNSRPDSLISFLIACFLYSGIRYLETRSMIWNLLAVGSTILAVWTKQTGIILIACWYITLTINSQHIQNLYNTLLYIVLFYGLFHIESTSLYILKLNLMDGVRNGIDFRDFYNWILAKLLVLIPLLITAIIFCYKWLTNHKSLPTKQFIAICCLLLFCFNLLTSLKQGARIGYFTDFLSIALVGSYLFLHEFKLRLYNKIMAVCWIIGLVYFGIFSTNFAFACKDVSHVEMYRSEKKLAHYIEHKYLKDLPGVKIIVVESFFAGQWTKHFLSRYVSAFASDALDMSPLDYSHLPEYVKSGQIRYLVRFRPTKIEPLGHKLNTLKCIYDDNGVEIYSLSDKHEVDTSVNITSLLTY